jgi:hypothetical protein
VLRILFVSIITANARRRQERELRDALESLRSQALQSDMARYAREDVSGGAPGMRAPPPDLQLLARKAVMLEHSLAAPVAPSRRRTLMTSR